VKKFVKSSLSAGTYLNTNP